jgi:hypothetical protein
VGQYWCADLPVSISMAAGKPGAEKWLAALLQGGLGAATSSKLEKALHQFTGSAHARFR